MCWCRPHQTGRVRCGREECQSPSARAGMTEHELAVAGAQNLAPDVAPETRPALLRLELAATTWSQITKYAGLLELTAEEFCRRAIEARVRECRAIESKLLRDRFREVLDA